ncbi:META domain-containing protein [Paraferrimonas haliotis]|uniref:Heat-shock protein HslJ n=1 Tax=Paraferrimonas haliotis TaxID=2013866 RepID=A0AA37TJK5_9GAMM|nr:META domain-containing protein [Paraferrimonas haliotis]GLS82424.1 heat-shock protein HslJ [Paraferrimonas haliotis]
MKLYIPLIIATIALSACQSAPSSNTQQAQLDLIGDWHIEQIGKQPVIDYSPARIRFDLDGRLSGNNSCNNFFGTYQQINSELSLAPAGSTMKACVDALMEQEQRTMQAMAQVLQAKMVKGRLHLLNAQKDTVLILTKKGD